MWILAVIAMVLSAIPAVAQTPGTEEPRPPSGIFMAEVPSYLNDAIYGACVELSRAHPISASSRMNVLKLVDSMPSVYQTEPDLSFGEKAQASTRAVKQMREIGGVGVIPILCEVMESSENEVMRQKASYALGIIASHESDTYREFKTSLFLPLWCRTTLDVNPDLRRDALNGLFLIAKSDVQNAPEVLFDAMLALYHYDPHPGIRNVAGFYLEQIEEQAADAPSADSVGT